jgi:hypothetical protein
MRIFLHSTTALQHAVKVAAVGRARHAVGIGYAVTVGISPSAQAGVGTG